MRSIHLGGSVAALLGLFAAACSSAVPTDHQPAEGPVGETAQRLVETHDYDDGSMSWGYGYDSAAGRSTGANCLAELGPMSPTQGSGGQVVTFSMEMVTSREELTKKLSADASVSASFGFGSGSARAEYVKTQTYNSYSLFLVARAKVVNATQWISPQRLSAYSEAEYVNRYEDFRRRCGDQFLAGLTTGGEFISVFEIKTRSNDEKESISASLRASGSLGNWSVAANFSSAVQKVTSESSVHVSSFQVGGVGDQAVPPTEPEKIIERATQLPNIVVGDAARGISASFKTYDVLELPPVNTEMFRRQKEYLRNVWLLAEGYRSELADRQYILENPGQFENPDANQLRTQITAIASQINQYQAKASACMNDVSACEGFPAPLTLDPAPRRLSNAEQNQSQLVVDALNKLRSLKGQAEGLLDDARTIDAGIGCGPSQITLADKVGQMRNDLVNKRGEAIAEVAIVRNLTSAQGPNNPSLTEAQAALTAIDGFQTQIIDVANHAWQVSHQPYATFRQGRGAQCGVELYNQREDASVCPPRQTRRHSTQTRCVPITDISKVPTLCDAGWTQTVEGVTTQGSCGGGFPGLKRNVEYKYTCSKTTYTCRHPSFGVERYNLCRDEAFGVEAYAACYKDAAPTATVIKNPLATGVFWNP